MSATRYKPDIEHDLLDAARILNAHPSEVYALNATCRRAVEAIRTARAEGFVAGEQSMREKAAKEVDDFHWTLPMYENREVNEASDDAAELVKEQIAVAIRALPISNLSNGERDE